MKAYPSIETRIDFSKSYYIFDKLDGSNIRAEWNPKKGFYKFGSRTQLLTEDQRTLFPSIDKIKELYTETMSQRLSKTKAESAVCFFEWVGPDSFAGSHNSDPSLMTPILIDVGVFKKGILPPEKFLELAEGLTIPKLLHRGRIDEDFFQSVRNRTLDGMTFEGVVGKGDFCQKSGGPIMFKIKSHDWLNKLKEICNNDEALYNRLK